MINALAMGASYDPDPTQFLGIWLSVTFDTCEIIEERWANWLRQDPVVAIETQANNLPRLNDFGIVHRYEGFADNHTGVDYRMDESLPFLAEALSG